METSIYRIFNALGDSIILSTYFKAFNIKKVFYNRAELDLLQTVMEMYGVHDIEFIHDANRKGNTMTEIVKDLHKKNITLLPYPKQGDDLYATIQLQSHHESARDRSMYLHEAMPHVKLNMPISHVGNEKTVNDLYKIMKNSCQHISIDSGTAWFATSLGLDTTVISKNSYYFPDAYVYMKYIESHKNVEVHQQHGKGIKIPNAFEYLQAAATNNVKVPPYEAYIDRVKLWK